MSLGGHSKTAASVRARVGAPAVLAAGLLIAACNIASGLTEFEVVSGSSASTSGVGGMGGGAGAGGTGGAGGIAGTGGTGGGGGTSGVQFFEQAVTQGSNDAEEGLASHEMYLDSSDLELGEDQEDWGPQLVGLRFEQVTIPRGSTILSARIDFVSDEPGTDPTSVAFHGLASDHVFPFMDVPMDLSSRPLTQASVSWNDVPPWTSLGQTHPSPDLSPIVQEIVDRQGWEADSALAFVIAGTGRRTAIAHDYIPASAPFLHVEYLLP